MREGKMKEQLYLWRTERKGHEKCVYHPNMTHLFSLWSLLLKLKQIKE